MIPERGAWACRGIVPNPWRASEGSISKRGGKLKVVHSKHPKLATYQQALIEELDRTFPKGDPLTIPLRVRFYFFRRLEYRSQRADATNLLKATEDALQGRLYVNDVENVHVESKVLRQEKDIESYIYVWWEPFVDHLPDELAVLDVYDKLVNQAPARADNSVPYDASKVF